MNIPRLTLIILCLTGSISCMHAQVEKRDFFIYGAIFQKFTHNRIKDVRAELLRTDSTVIDTMRTNEHMIWGKYAGCWNFNIGQLGKPSRYIVRLRKEGFQPTYIDIPEIDYTAEKDKWAKDFGISEMSLPPRQRTPQQLGEAVVKASKVAFYYKGDTLVYNASAFELAEGSMLDALIQRLDGVTLDDNGEIKINGRHVDKLLLNGKNFFDDNRQLMLDNLPAYMVKDVKVYEQETDEMRFLGKSREKNRDEMPYVMDVKLKKEFSIGWVANAEAGYGTEDRYLGRLFLMRFTPRSQLVALGGINNLNDGRRPGQNSSWTPETMPTGSVVNRTGGADYNFEDEMTKFKYRASFTGSHQTSDMYNESASEDFITGGNTFGRSMSHRHTANSSLNLNQELSFETGKIRMSHLLDGMWWHNRSRSKTANASFNADPSLYVPNSAQLLDSIQGPAGNTLLRRLAVYRTLNRTRNNSEGGSVDYRMSMLTKKYWQVSANARFSSDQSTLFNHYLIDHPYSGASSDFQNRYDRTSPNRKSNYGLSASKNKVFGKNQDFFFSTEFSFNQDNNRLTASYYRLDRLSEWANNTDHALGTLPSETGWMQLTHDSENSYFVHSINTTVKATPALSYYVPLKEQKGKNLTISLRAPLEADLQWLDHQRSTYDRTTHRTDLKILPQASISYSFENYAGEASLSYRMTQQSPDLFSQLLDFPNDRDPLNTYNGNPDLHRSTTHHIEASFSRYISSKQVTYNVGLSHKVTKMGFARGYTYNRQTGVRYYRPLNVDGNNTTTFNARYSTPFDRQKRLKFSTRTYVMHQQGVDLITPIDEVDGTLQPEAVPTRSTVQTWWCTENMELRYTFQKFSIGVNGYLGYNNTNSKRPGFVSQNIWDYTYGLTLQTTVVWGIDLSTDLKMYSRRGFSDPSGNRNDLVWNLRLSRTWGKPGLTFMVDGFDILQQLSNRTFSMTSSGRWETYRNALPSYFVAHVLWRINKKPKKD